MLHPDRPDWREVRGLSQSEAERRLRAEGANELPGGRRRTLSAILADAMREPMFLLLAVASAIYFALGSLGDAAVLAGSVAVVLAITVYQEQRTERALETLRDLASPRALVVRDGERRRIPGREVVRGDILVLAEGDRVPADAAVLALRNLRLDESLLTGESVPVSKTHWNGKDAPARPGGDGLPWVYSGTLVVQGTAIAQVIATGPRSEIGRIGKALQTIAPEPTPRIGISNHLFPDELWYCRPRRRSMTRSLAKIPRSR